MYADRRRRRRFAAAYPVNSQSVILPKDELVFPSTRLSFHCPHHHSGNGLIASNKKK